MTTTPQATTISGEKKKKLSKWKTDETARERELEWNRSTLTNRKRDNGEKKLTGKWCKVKSGGRHLSLSFKPFYWALSGCAGNETSSDSPLRPCQTAMTRVPSRQQQRPSMNKTSPPWLLGLGGGVQVWFRVTRVTRRKLRIKFEHTAGNIFLLMGRWPPHRAHVYV